MLNATGGGAIDPTVLAKLEEDLGGEDSVMRELIGIFLGEAPGFVARMREALAKGDEAAIRHAAHTLKSTSAAFGATRLAEMCRRLEAGAGAETAALVAESEREYARVRDELRARYPA